MQRDVVMETADESDKPGQAQMNADGETGDLKSPSAYCVL